MRCGDVSMFAGPMGRKNGHIAVRIENKAAREGDV
jgi:flagellar motor switch protein FliM